MKKIFLGSLVGAILLFGWQSLSWTVLGIHEKAMSYTPAQDSLLNTLSNTLKQEGQYILPTLPPNSSGEDYEKLSKSIEGKPWAMVTYHETHHNDMLMNMIRGFLTCFVCVWLCCVIIGRQQSKGFYNGFSTALIFGLVSFLFVWYIGHIWMGIGWYVLKGEMIDALVGWGLSGIWLGWWYSRRS
ncbi:MAG TPA: hypothetical protein PLC48_06280 [Ferruginibacter sp.]|nr:hypothetical protein [Ferruginibacter sp.]